MSVDTRIDVDTGLIASWIDGQPDASLSITDRGLAYGHGLFETLLLKNGNVVALERHLSRLVNDAVKLGFQGVEKNRLRGLLQDCLKDHSEGVVKLIVTGADGGRGYYYDQGTAPRFIVGIFSPPTYPEHYYTKGVTATVCRTALAHQPQLSGIKHLCRLEQVLARMEWRQEYQEGLMLDSLGHVVEGTMTNLFMVRAGQLMTHPLDQCGIKGVMRERVLEAATNQGLPVALKGVSLDEMIRMDEVFLSNSVIGIWPVRAVAQSQFHIGPVTKKLMGWVQHD